MAKAYIIMEEDGRYIDDNDIKPVFVHNNKDAAELKMKELEKKNRRDFGYPDYWIVEVEMELWL